MVTVASLGGTFAIVYAGQRLPMFSSPRTYFWLSTRCGSGAWKLVYQLGLCPCRHGSLALSSKSLRGPKNRRLLIASGEARDAEQRH